VLALQNSKGKKTIDSAVESYAEVLSTVGGKKLVCVLHVDDETDFLKMSKSRLEAEGTFQVDTASSVDEALERMREESYDVIVSDYQMPHKTGLQFLRELRKDGNNVPFIILTDRNRGKAAMEALNLGARQYLTKTGSSEDLFCELACRIREVVQIRNVEKAAEMTVSLLRATLDSTADGILVVDNAGKIESFNQRFAEMWNIPESVLTSRDDDRALAFVLDQLRNPEDFLRKVRELYSHKEAESFDVIEFKDGRVFERYSKPQILDNSIIGRVWSFRNVTERKRTEEALIVSEEKFRTMVETCQDVIMLANSDGVILYSSPASIDVLGYYQEELVGKQANIVFPDDLEDAKQVNDATLKGKNGSKEYCIVTKAGEKRWVHHSWSSLITEDKPKVIISIIRNITDRKEQEMETSASQSKFKGLFIGNPEAAVYLGQDFGILDINPCFEKLFGYSLAEIRGKHINDVIVQKERIEEAKRLDDKALNGYVYHNTLRRRKDGSLVPVSVSAAPIKVEGRLIGYVGMYKDISELKNVEKKLESMNEKLHVVGGLTRHDVRNKLSIITGNIYLARKKIQALPGVLENLEDIDSACKQIVEIFNFAKDYEMLGVDELTYIYVEDAVKKAVSLFSDLKGVRLAVKCSGLAVLADSLFRQLLYNLLDNSLKHGEKVSLIKIYYEKVADGEIKLIYEDDGVGIPASDKPKLFKEGYTTGEGSGYGLCLIRKIVEVYGWSITETSGPGKGAQFTIQIPKANRNRKENYLTC
jgi:PAS domain S-box-containing protein